MKFTRDYEELTEVQEVRINVQGKISIVVPVYKVEIYLNRCVESIVNQTYNDLEIILVDDGSPDSCPLMCEEWAHKDNRIRVIHKENGGLSDARNSGIDRATGEYILFVDSDDYLELDACEKLLRTMKKTDSDFVVGVIREIRGNRIDFQRRSIIKSNCVYNNKDFIIKSIETNEWYAPAVLNLYKTSFLNQYSLRFKVGILHEDLEILPRLYMSATRISYLDYPFYNYEIRENSIMTSNDNVKKINSIIFIYDSWKKQFDKVLDLNLQKKLYGVLIKHYLYSCRIMGIKKWLIDGLDFNFSFKNSLNRKERIKCVMFNLAPSLYTKRGK